MEQIGGVPAVNRDNTITEFIRVLGYYEGELYNIYSLNIYSHSAKKCSTEQFDCTFGVQLRALFLNLVLVTMTPRILRLYVRNNIEYLDFLSGGTMKKRHGV